jgi:(p)ppGpp synthase/HD superfamily hydrolase
VHIAGLSGELMKAYSNRYEAALVLAAQAHRDQERKVGSVPYITHLVHVSVILLRYGYPEDIVIAGLLHDIVEDTDIPLEKIETDFGPVVAGVVAALSERKLEGDVKRPWEERKLELLAQLRQSSAEAVAVKAADTLHSTRSLTIDLRREGSLVWRNFSRGPGPSLQYYQSVAGLVRDKLGDHPLAGELEQAVQDLRQAIAETGDT